jgi:hypothetical protein
MYEWREFELGRWSQYGWIAHARTKSLYIDPYLIWADLREFADLGGDRPQWIPVLLRLRDSAAAFAQLVLGSPGLRQFVRVPRLYGKDASPQLAAAQHCTAAITSAAFAELLDTGGRLKGQVEELQLGLPVSGIDAEPKLQQIDSPPPPRKARREPVVVGVIDSGFAFAHRRFRSRDGLTTRIEAFWDQRAGWSAPNPRNVVARARGAAQIADVVPYGTELLGGAIDRLLENPRPEVDEDAIYRSLQYPGADLRASHGTHVLDLACGYGPGDAGPAARLPHIVCVALPRQTTADTAGLSLGVYALDALRYILDRADRLVPGANIVVNLSYGNIAGPHDGSSLLEQAIDELVRLRREPPRADGRARRSAGRLEVVIAAGNNHLSRCHAQLSLHGGQTSRPLAWRILPDDATPSFIEVWMRKDAPPARLAVQLATPTGETSDWVEPGMVRELRSDDGVIASIIHLATGRRRMILVAAAPTVADERRCACAPAGLWQLRIKRLDSGAEPVAIDAWIQRDDNVHGFRRRGRQSYFDDPDYLRFDAVGRPVEEDQPGSYVRRAGTLNAIGTGEETIVVGGYRGSDGAPATYSPRGPEAPGDAARAGPDLMSVSERSVTRRGVLGAGTRSGAMVAMNGTSVAAPQVTRWIAEQMAAGEPGTPEALRARAREDDPDAKPKPGRGRNPVKPPPREAVKPKPPKARGGAGRIGIVPRGEDRPDVVRPFGKR